MLKNAITRKLLFEVNQDEKLLKERTRNVKLVKVRIERKIKTNFLIAYSFKYCIMSGNCHPT